MYKSNWLNSDFIVTLNIVVFFIYTCIVYRYPKKVGDVNTGNLPPLKGNQAINKHVGQEEQMRILSRRGSHR